MSGSVGYSDAPVKHLCRTRVGDANSSPGDVWQGQLMLDPHVIGARVKQLRRAAGLRQSDLGAGGWTTRDLADADMARVVALTDEGLTVREIAEETGITRSRVNRMQQQARADGSIGAAGHA